MRSCLAQNRVVFSCRLCELTTTLPVPPYHMWPLPVGMLSAAAVSVAWSVLPSMGLCPTHREVAAPIFYAIPAHRRPGVRAVEASRECDTALTQLPLDNVSRCRTYDSKTHELTCLLGGYDGKGLGREARSQLRRTLARYKCVSWVLF